MTERSDAEILFPDRDVTLSSGRVVRVRELPYGESLALQGRPGGPAFIAAAHTQAAPGGVPDQLVLLSLGAEHPAWWLAFLEAATGLQADEVAALPVVDGMRVALAATAVNAGFFAVAVTMHRPPTTTPSPTPSPSSSATDTSDQPT